MCSCQYTYSSSLQHIHQTLGFFNYRLVMLIILSEEQDSTLETLSSTAKKIELLFFYPANQNYSILIM